MACATPRPSRDLLDARDAYQRASRDRDALKSAPQRIVRARIELEKAEDAYRDDPQSKKEKHAAYLSMRNAQIAMAEGKRSREERRRALLLDKEHAALLALQQSAERAKAEAASALDVLHREGVVEVREEFRAKVMSLAADDLFVDGTSTLLPSAAHEIDRLADAVGLQSASKYLVVEGHMDTVSAGQAASTLSSDRARVIARELVVRGVPRDRIRAVGIGSTRPIAGNDTADGRARNRRVDVLISDEEVADFDPTPPIPIAEDRTS